MIEIWKPVNGYEGLYEVSSLGRVKSMPKKWVCGVKSKREKGETILKICTSTLYPTIALNGGGRGRRTGICVHRLVAEAFIVNPQNKPEVNHKNGIKSDNRVHNLEWVTSSENRIHAFSSRLKISKRNGNHHCSKPIMVINLRIPQVYSFPSISSAVNELGMSESMVRGNLVGRYNSWNYKFEYI